MPTLTEAIYVRLAGDATLTAMLATYGGEPAIFTFDPVPEDATFPFVVVHGTESDEENDAKDCDGRDVRRQIRSYTEGRGSVVAVEAIAERVRELFHRQPIGLLPGAYVAACSGPTSAPTDPDLYGRAVTVRVESLT